MEMREDAGQKTGIRNNWIRRHVFQVRLPWEPRFLQAGRSQRRSLHFPRLFPSFFFFLFSSLFYFAFPPDPKKCCEIAAERWHRAGRRGLATRPLIVIYPWQTEAINAITERRPSVFFRLSSTFFFFAAAVVVLSPALRGQCSPGRWRCSFFLSALWLCPWFECKHFPTAPEGIANGRLANVRMNFRRKWLNCLQYFVSRYSLYKCAFLIFFFF